MRIVGAAFRKRSWGTSEGRGGGITSTVWKVEGHSQRFGGFEVTEADSFTKILPFH